MGEKGEYVHVLYVWKEEKKSKAGWWEWDIYLFPTLMFLLAKRSYLKLQSSVSLLQKSIAVHIVGRVSGRLLG